MSTTIQIDESIRDSLNAMKIHSRETYSDVIQRLLEDQSELNDETKREIKRAVKEIESGKYRTHDDLKEEMGL